MLSLLSICAALLVTLATFKYFFSTDAKKGKTIPETNIKLATPWWFMIVRHLFQKKSTDEVMKEIAEKYGPVAYVRLGFGKKVFVSDAELCRRVLGNVDDYQKAVFFSPDSAIAKFTGHSVVTENGDEWRKQRKVINPAFKVQMIKSFTNGFIEKIQTFLDIVDKGLKAAEAKNEPFVFEPNDLLQKMTLDVLGKAVFDYDFNYMQNDKQDEFITAYHHITTQVFSAKFIFMPWLLNSGLYKDVEKQMAIFDTFLYKLIDARRKHLSAHPDEEPKDLLGLMLQSAEDEVFTDRQVRDNVFVFFIAGHETTAGALSSALYSMGLYPKEQAKLLEEVNKLEGAVPTYDNATRFEYIQAFTKEVMRVYTPAALILRETVKDMQLGDYVIPEKTKVALNIHGIHHSPTLWKDPEVFNPARFLQKSTSDSDDDRSSWMGFGTGPRACIGNNFSLLEQKLFLAMFLQRFEVEQCPDYELKLPIAGIMRPIDLKVIIKRRPQT
eukprot:TRINITY_DN15592_c0_g1_i1.p1 TRINITY_DN15592_c0_g1~~TRINITY_DN15592_c0_g1_i1.p1  ORF type:complete len:496 (+),score=139.14 TRINITY_DN15592_c0_g1_i1:173-1660(+)